MNQSLRPLKLRNGFGFLFEQWIAAKAQGGAGTKPKEFLFKITFAQEPNLKGKKLKQAIDDFHFLTPGTTKRIKSKVPEQSGNEALTDVNDGSKRYKLGSKVYKLFKGVPYWYNYWV